MPLCLPSVDHSGVIGLPDRLRPHARIFLDLGLVVFLALLWATGDVTLWLHLGYISIALGAFLRPRARSTAVRAGVLSLVGGAELLRLYSQGILPGDDLLEIPLMSVLALLFAGFSYQRSRAEDHIRRDKRHLAMQIERNPLATIVFDEDSRVVTWNSTAEHLFRVPAAEG